MSKFPYSAAFEELKPLLLDMLPVMDNLLYNVQRQGKISFYVSNQTGQGVLYVPLIGHYFIDR
jgi:hypothetical protein